ncbi:MAG TPA: cyclopropane-fatty-acyl-phospholipid synthase family protein [Burkholderiales bacterium]|nr:cyclopropane-fatty-acyl-phospholipid synthase family protein [Burkholderiales bacterium]
MLLESRIRKILGELSGKVKLPLALELWNGERYELSPSPTVTLRVPSAGALRYLIKPDLAKLGEAYVEGHLEIRGPIADALRAAEGLSRNLGDGKRGRLPLLRRRHSKRRDAEAIAYHYDVSNDFYALWLDRNMVYSCAYFKTGDEDIDTAQEQKLEHICRKLRLGPGDKLLDIGCGWGGLVRWAAKHYGVDATGITLSRNQHALASERIKAEGLSDRCRVLLQDYRDVPGTAVYDKISSVGMFEHVGLKNLPLYFGVVKRLLKDGGIALNHGITSVDPDSRTVGLGGDDFIERYVFPHGELPHASLALREMAAAGLEVMDIETLRLHYARTLWLWSERLEANLDAALAFAGAKRLRIWRAYLAGCAYGFEQRWVSIHQMLAVKTGDATLNPLPWSRDWIYR